MTGTRLKPLTREGLRRVPASCDTCPLGPGSTIDPESTWVRAAEDEWGQVGVVAIDQAREPGVDQVMGLLLFCPPLHAPRRGPHQGGGLSPDAAVVLSIRVRPEYAGSGVGRQLVQAAAARVARGHGLGSSLVSGRFGPHRLRALEVRGTRLGGSCALPEVDFLHSCGFEITRDHPVTPRLRLDLSSTVRWRWSLSSSLERMADWVRPAPPEPTTRSSRTP